MMVDNFRTLIMEAVNNDKKAVWQIIDMYMPLIVKNSYINGKLDDDLKQEIILKVINNLSKFTF